MDARSDKSIKESWTEELRSFEAPGVADGQEIGVDQERRHKARFLARESPEATPEIDVPLRVGPEDQAENDLGIDCGRVKGGRAGPQVASEASRRQFAAEKEILLPTRCAGV